MSGESGEIWTALPPLQPNHPESDRLLGSAPLPYTTGTRSQVNYLAHLFLSPPGEDAMLGSLMGDFVKGPLTSQAIIDRYSTEMTRAIALHRKIDSYTDSHRVVRESWNRVSNGRRRFAGIMVDIFYDHYLAKYWNEFHDQPLAEFTGDFYAILARRHAEMPARLQGITHSMIGLDWLGSYAQISSVHTALNRIGLRLRRDNTLFNSADELLENYAELELDFRRFIPDAVEFVRRSASTL